MNISELLNLAKWIAAEIVETQIVQKYQALQTILQQNTQPNQQKQPFEIQKNDLITSLENIHLEVLTKDQLKFLENLNIYQAVGNYGIDILEDILYKNVIDMPTSANKIQEIIQKLNIGIKKINQIKSGLEDCIFEEEYELKDEILIRVSFTGYAKISNVTDFKSWGKIWYEIGHGIAMVHGSTPDDIRIIGATKGSIVIELAVIASIATTTSAIILAALKVAEKVLDIRKKAEELRGLKLKNDKLAHEIEKEAENEKKLGIEIIVSEITTKLELKSDIEGDKITALTKSINNLVMFIEKGGEVDFVIPEENHKNDDDDIIKHKYEELRIAFQEIRKLESKLKLIEHKVSFNK